MGLDQMPVAERGPDATLPLITGAYGGHTIDLRAYAAQGIALLGRLRSAAAGILHFAADLRGSLAYGDAAHDAFLARCDAYVEQKGLPLPVEGHARARLAEPNCVRRPTCQLDYRATGISTVIWATGYSFDFSWIDLPILNGRGEPQHDRGIAPIQGLYFLGLPWLSKMNSSFLNGVGDDAARLAEHIRSGAAALSSSA
jgi:putative flavoprotein involved in K+ transport